MLSRAITYAYERGCRTFYTGGALGFDTAAAKEIIRFRMTHTDVRLILVLPCVNQDEKWNSYERAAYEYTLSLADSVEYVTDEYYDGCMRDRNMRLAELCDILIAYVGKEMGGSAQTVRFAKKLGREVYNIYPALARGE